MTSPRYVNDIGNVYAQMYNLPDGERVLEEKSKDDDYDIPKWARILHKHKQEEDRKQPPYTAHVEPEIEPEEDENENIRTGDNLANTYVELRNQAKVTELKIVEDQAQEYLKTVMDEVPGVVGGVNLHTEIKKAFIAGTNAK